MCNSFSFHSLYPTPGLLILGISISLLQSGSGVASSYFLGYVVDAFNTTPVDIVFISLILAAIFLTYNIATIADELIWKRVEIIATGRLRSTFLEIVTTRPILFYDKHNTNELASAFMSNMESMSRVISVSVSLVSKNIIQK